MISFGSVPRTSLTPLLHNERLIQQIRDFIDLRGLDWMSGVQEREEEEEVEEEGKEAAKVQCYLLK